MMAIDTDDLCPSSVKRFIMSSVINPNEEGNLRGPERVVGMQLFSFFYIPGHHKFSAAWLKSCLDI